MNKKEDNDEINGLSADLRILNKHYLNIPYLYCYSEFGQSIASAACLRTINIIRQRLVVLYNERDLKQNTP
jgi:hypothetical protein